METSGEYKTTVYGNGASYSTSSCGAGTWLIQTDDFTLPHLLTAIRDFMADYPELLILDIKIMRDYVIGGYIAVVQAEGQL